MSEYKSPELYISDVEHVPAAVDNKLVDYMNKNNDAVDAALRIQAANWASFLGDCDTGRQVAAMLVKAGQDATASARALFQDAGAIQAIAYRGFQDIGANDYDSMIGISKTMDGWK